MIDEEAIRYRWENVGSRLDERGRRLFAAAEVRTAGWGGLAVVSQITGLARSTINRGEDDLDAAPLPQGQVRRTGGGRKAVSEKDPGLIPELQRLVEPATLGDPERPLQWVSKSMDKLADTLTAMGHPISADTVARELVKLGYSRQSNRKADDQTKLKFSLDTELQPGINVITVVARESEDTTSRYTMIVRRDGPNGEALKTSRADAFGEDMGLDAGD